MEPTVRIGSVTPGGTAKPSMDSGVIDAPRDGDPFVNPRTKAGFWSAGAILFIAAGLSILSVERFEADAEWVAHTHEVIERAQVVLAQMLEVQSALRGYVITGGDRFLLPFDRARGATLAELQGLRRLTMDNAEQLTRLDQLGSLITQRLEAASLQAAARQSGGFDGGKAAVSAGAGEDLMAKIRLGVADFSERERSLLSGRRQRSSRSARMSLAAITGLTMVAFAVLGWTASRTRREIVARAKAQAHVVHLNQDLEQQAAALADEVAVRKAAEEAARRRNEDLKGFAYTVSHDLKAPLRGISGYAQELERRHQEGLGERAKFCVTQIITASKNLDALIDDLLRYARLDAEPPRASNVNLAELVASLMRDRKHTVTELGVDVKISVAPTSFQVWERGLHQVLANLIDNAIKYSRNSAPPTLTIASEVSPDVCTIKVTDNGIGFDMKYHDRIFGLFNRLVRSTEFEGTGAGLAIVKKVVEKLGGSIRAQSAPGQGATFILEVPTHNTLRS